MKQNRAKKNCEKMFINERILNFANYVSIDIYRISRDADSKEGRDKKLPRFKAQRTVCIIIYG